MLWSLKALSAPLTTQLEIHLATDQFWFLTAISHYTDTEYPKMIKQIVWLMIALQPQQKGKQLEHLQWCSECDPAKIFHIKM
jgi:hypothetical protein